MTRREGAPAFLAGGGVMGTRMRAYDWSATPLGLPETWPSSLRAVVQIMLTSRFAMWLAWGADLTFFCNDAYLPTTGLKRDWVLGARSDRVWAEIWPDIGPRIRQVLETGQATWDEALLLYLERSGFTEETYHTFSYSPLDDDEGRTAGMLCVVAEVTERVIGERQLAMLRDLGSRLAAAATRSEVMRALEACLAAEPRDLPFALAYLHDAGAREAVLAAVHGIDREAPAAPPRVSLEGDGAIWPFGQLLEGGVERVDVRANALPGLDRRPWQVMPHAALVVPVVGAEGGTPVGFLVAGLNPHRALDAGYLGFIDLVAGQLAAAIARADEYERERARAEALAEIDRAKTAFFSNVSHEFRTPLTLMLGPLEDALADPLLPPAQAEPIALAHRNGLRLLRLVNGLLDFSRIEAGRVEASFQPTDLARYTGELASTFRSACERAGLAFEVDCPPLAQPVYVDRDMWEKIVLNLLSNAFKFTLSGSIRVSLRAGDGMAELSVKDTGSGIPEHELPRLFERFHRVEGTRGRSFEGTGIGLALVHDLVAQHGGSVRVESREGHGSTFRVRIPLGKAHLPPARVEAAPAATSTATRAQAFVDEALRWLPASADAPAATTEAIIDDVDREGPSGGAALAPLQHGRVLLADDNADLRDYVGRLLTRRGYDVEAVADGSAALEAARRRRPDLLLTDVMMPGLDGFALLAAVRADPTLSDMPVVMLSARAGEEAQVEGLGAGADDYLAKPFSARELLARVAAHLDMARTRRQAGEALRASEARLRGVLEGMGEAFLLVDHAMRLCEINAEGLRLDGRSREELYEQPIMTVAPLAGHPDLEARLRASMAERQPMACEIRQVSAGRDIWLDLRAYPTEDGGLALFCRDVTDRRDAETALRHLNETLERRVEAAVAEREVALARLHEAQKIETIDQLTGGVAHDFNNLLTPMMAGLDLLARWHPEPRSQRMIDAALQSAERAKTLIQRLLAFARRQALAPRPVDPATLVAGMRELIARSLGPALRIDVEVPPDLPPALVDANQLELALLNLAVNARDAMDGMDGGRLTIRAAAEIVSARDGPADLGPGRYIRFDVADTGRGMDPATLARAVEPFFSTKATGKGTGLGLSMVHGLALQSGGAFHITSRLGRGTTASLWLPVTDEAAMGGIAPAPEVARSPRRASLLLVDDEPLVRAGTAGLLRELGYEVVEAESAAEALDHVRQGFRPELVVTDHMMPGMTGVRLASELRTRLPGLPVLIITGYVDVGSEETRGFDVLGKPFSLAELAARVATLVDWPQPAAQGSAAL